jgi:phenylalanyl-tRNA synthetase alpha chain
MNVAALAQLEQHTIQSLADATTLEAVDELERAAVGRKSPLAETSQSLGSRLPQERATLGKAINQAKIAILQAATARRATLESQSQSVDVSVPATLPSRGHLHPTTQTTREILDIFAHLGMHYIEAPEVDYDWYAFELLNMHRDHPARDEWETFFVDLPSDDKRGSVVLRPHTTNFEGHLMETEAPPFRYITVGKTYRRQADASHTPMFHQFEGFMVDKGLSIGNLVATLEYFVHNYFGPNVKTRLRPYHFRFTEPSFELDISCTICGGTGCKLCKDGWLELGGAGMTHPAVLRNGGIDPTVFSGFAWGWGVERCFAIRHQIDDIRMVYENDLRFLEQF